MRGNKNEGRKRSFDADALADLLTDLGSAGSGRVRDGATRQQDANHDQEPARVVPARRVPKHGGGKVDGKEAQTNQAAAPVPARKGRSAQARAARGAGEAATPQGTPAPVPGQEAFRPLDLDPKHHPRRHPPGSLKRGDSVWYRGERFWVEYAPSTWLKGHYARISSKPIHPDEARSTPTEQALSGVKTDHASFCVHCDLLELAPQRKNLYADQPTQADLARKERAARGVHDVGDEIATLLREAKSIDDVYRIGAKYLAIPEEELRDKYGHLNPGQQRMNVGNRMRAKWRKEHAH